MEIQKGRRIVIDFAINYSLDDFFKELSERISEIGREKIIVTPTEYFYMFRKIFEEIKEEKLGKD